MVLAENRLSHSGLIRYFNATFTLILFYCYQAYPLLLTVLAKAIPDKIKTAANSLLK